MITLIQHLYLQNYCHYLNSIIPNTLIPENHWVCYQLSILYNLFTCITFVGLNNVLYYHLIQVIFREMQQIFCLLVLHKICFWNCLQATCKKAFAVILIRLLYSTQYWAMIDQSSHSHMWLSIFFNNTIIHFYWHY